MGKCLSKGSNAEPKDETKSKGSNAEAKDETKPKFVANPSVS